MIMAKLAKKNQDSHTDVVAAIDAGEYDDKLRAIVRACYKRRLTIAPDSHVGLLSPKLEKFYPSPKPIAPEVVNSTDSGTYLSTPNNGFTYFYVDHPTLRQVPKGRRIADPDSVLRYGGKRYYVNSMLGTAVRIVNSQAHPALNGLQSTKVGLRSYSADLREFEAVFLTEPSDRAPGAYRDRWERSEFLQLPQHLIYPYLEE